MVKITDLCECPFCNYDENLSLMGKIRNFLSSSMPKSIIEIPILIFSVPILICSYFWAKKGKTCVERYKNVVCPNEERAIFIINHQNSIKNLYVLGSGVAFLVSYFKSNSIKFKIYDCYNPDDFYTAIKESKAQNLWIFGHGNRHCISFGKDGRFPFCKIVGVERKSFIAQFHCCHQNGKSLWEYLSDKPGIFSEGYRNVVQNRMDVEKWVKDNQVQSKKLKS